MLVHLINNGCVYYTKAYIKNRLRFVLGEKYAGYYGYNADGERVYKLTGISNLGQVNSGSTKAQAIFDEAVLYPNPYMVVTRKGYTKHYYAGARAKSAEHADAWDKFFKKNHHPTKEQVLQQRDIIEKKVWSDAPKGETPVN